MRLPWRRRFKLGKLVRHHLSINWTMALGSMADVHKTWEPVTRINFDFDNRAVEADDGAGIDFGEHGAKCS